MTFSLKKLAAALALAAAATGASAAIDNGAGGNGELFFGAWDGTTSYTYDLNLSINAFESAFSGAGKTNLSWGSDFTSSFAAWLGTADTGLLEWSILSVDTSGQRRLITTVDPTNELPATNNPAGDVRGAAGAISIMLTELNQSIVGNSFVTTSNTAPTYVGNLGGLDGQGGILGGLFNFDTSGTHAANSYANGLLLQKTTANASGTAFGINTAYVDEGAAVKAWVDGEGLHIAAVPEPSETAMLLAGLGLIGFAARRKARRA